MGNINSEYYLVTKRSVSGNIIKLLKIKGLSQESLYHILINIIKSGLWDEDLLLPYDVPKKITPEDNPLILSYNSYKIFCTKTHGVLLCSSSILKNLEKCFNVYVKEVSLTLTNLLDTGFSFYITGYKHCSFPDPFKSLLERLDRLTKHSIIRYISYDDTSRIIFSIVHFESNDLKLMKEYIVLSTIPTLLLCYSSTIVSFKIFCQYRENLDKYLKEEYEIIHQVGINLPLFNYHIEDRIYKIKLLCYNSLVGSVTVKLSSFFIEGFSFSLDVYKICEDKFYIPFLDQEYLSITAPNFYINLYLYYMNKEFKVIDLNIKSWLDVGLYLKKMIKDVVGVEVVLDI